MDEFQQTESLEAALFRLGSHSRRRLILPVVVALLSAGALIVAAFVLSLVAVGRVTHTQHFICGLISSSTEASSINARERLDASKLLAHYSSEPKIRAYYAKRVATLTERETQTPTAKAVVKAIRSECGISFSSK